MKEVRSVVKNNTYGIVVKEMSKKSLDIAFGKLNEQEMLPVLDKFFNDKHHKERLPSGEEWEFDRHDFFNADRTKKRELKTRRIHSSDYSTAVVNHSKIINQDPSIKYTYIWKFTDGCFYLDYDVDFWTEDNGFYVSTMKCWRDGKCEIQPVMNVPHRHLKKLEV